VFLTKKTHHQRGAKIMTQNVLPFKYEEEKTTSGMTAVAGLPLFLELFYGMGLNKCISANLAVRDEQGHSDAEVIKALMMLNLAGGDSVDDIQILEGDIGFKELARKAEKHRESKKAKKKALKRWRKQRKRGFASCSAIFRYLKAFHDEQQDKRRVAGKAFIPAPNEYLSGFPRINEYMMDWLQERRPSSVATLDQDATLINTNKKQALFCYQGFLSYQPVNTYWAEHGIVAHSEFRDGNVPAGYQQLRVLKETLAILPESVKRVRLRSDTAGYQHDLLRYCEQGENERFGRIEFGISCDVTPEFRKAVIEVAEAQWQPLFVWRRDELVRSEQEWAEVVYVPNKLGFSSNDPSYRYIAIREKYRQMLLPGIEVVDPPELHIETMGNQRYKVFGMVTNMDWEGGRLIRWQRERCGKGEEVHGIMKDDLAGGKLPCGEFGANAAWWWIMVLAFNLQSIFKSHVLPAGWENKRLKSIRFNFINLPGRLIKRSRQLIVRLTSGHSSNALIWQARERLRGLVYGPAG
jgi:hypothetical protein